MGIGSITKTFVSATLLLLMEDDLLALDDSIGRYLENYPNVPAGATIRQLLGHRTGINDYLNENIEIWNTWFSQPDSLWSVDSILHNHILGPNFEVGSSWSYSNTNYLLAGRIIQNITGQPWHHIVRERIIEPMGLNHTFIYPYESPGSQNFANCWADYDMNGQPEDLQGSGVTMDGFFSLASSAGCIISNPEDMVNFSQQLYGSSFLQPSTLAEMQIDYTNGSQGFLYGLGTTSAPQLFEENWGHQGNIIYLSTGYYFPGLNKALAVQQNDRRSGYSNIDLNDVFLALLNAYNNFMPTSIENQLDVVEKINIFPNPCKNYVSIEFNEVPHTEGVLSILNRNGQILHSENIKSGEQKSSIDLSELPEGSYLINIAIGKLRGIKPLVIVR